MVFVRYGTQVFVFRFRLTNIEHEARSVESQSEVKIACIIVNGNAVRVYATIQSTFVFDLFSASYQQKNDVEVTRSQVFRQFLKRFGHKRGYFLVVFCVAEKLRF